MIEPKKYKRLPVVIEAIEFTGKNGLLIERWSDGQARFHVTATSTEMVIHTLEGTMYGKPGSFIIKGVEGEIYPCDPDIFHKIYEEVLP